jgi:hypothetical protein
MSTQRRIVSYREMAGAFHPYLEEAGRGQGSGVRGGGEEGLEAAPEAPPADTMSEISAGLQALEGAGRNPDVMNGTEHEMASLLQTFFAQQATRDQPAAGEGLEAKFDNLDLLRWIGSFFTWWKGIKKAPWKTAEASPTTVPSAFRIAVFGDWATGLYGAPVCARSIAGDKKPFQVVMHLGDTYYSGDEPEIRERLLQVWPQVPGALNRALNGNHEMYTGGHGYFNIALPHFGQTSSYFAFQNDHWILACLDSAYSDHDLYGEQVDWLTSLVANGGDQRLILFTHHQPFSLLDGQGPKLVAKLKDFLEAKRIFAWYWGHEHHCMLYDAHPVWGLLGRCVGHGGFPYFREADFGAAPAKPTWVRLDSKHLVPGAEVLDGPNPYVRGHEKEYGPHGYVALDFDGPRLNEAVVEADGTILREVELTARGQ